MLRNRSIVVTQKQALMADQTPSFSPTKKPTTPVSSFLSSPRFFNSFLSKKVHQESETMTPTSILDTKSTSCFVNPFAYETKIPPEINKLEPQAIGLALIDSLVEENNDEHFSKPINRMMLFGSKLKVHIPTDNDQTSPVESPRFCKGDYGIKTRNLQISSPLTSNAPAREFNRQLSLKEMELSEEYTCVITHGPNPKTTHIYDGCIVESCSEDDDAMFDDDDDDSNGMDFEPNFPNSPVNFLSYCYNCKDKLDQGKDIYIYRGEKAFCSQECRGQEMLFDMKNP